MPIYEYSCPDCGHTFKHLHRMMNEAKPPCPQCGKDNVKKIFSTFAVKTASTGCNAKSCPAEAGHHCCPGCCHHHH